MNNNQTQPTTQPNPKRFQLKTWQWLPVLIIVAVIVGGVFWYINQHPQIPKEVDGNFQLRRQTQEDCQYISDIDLRSKCYYSLALQDSDSSFCDLALYNEDECYRALAKKLNDPSLCENGRVNKCICYTGIAQESRDPSYCEYCLKDEYWYIGSEDYREPHGIQCYRAYAKFGSASDCDELKDQDIREKCYFGFAHTANSIAFCNKITNVAWRDLCYYDARDGLSACEKIIDSQIRDKCYNAFACYFDQSMHNWVPLESTCDKIIDKAIKNACYLKRQQCMEPLR